MVVGEWSPFLACPCWSMTVHAILSPNSVIDTHGRTAPKGPSFVLAGALAGSPVQPLASAACPACSNCSALARSGAADWAAPASSRLPVARIERHQPAIGRLPKSTSIAYAMKPRCWPDVLYAFVRPRVLFEPEQGSRNQYKLGATRFAVASFTAALLDRNALK